MKSPEAAVREKEADSRKKEALRIQAAAVAAQQASLTEEEIRLLQRRGALERQEAQLVAHLEDKRRRLIEVRDQARAAHATFKEERAAYERRVEETTASLAEARADLDASQQQAQTERRRLAQLHKRMKLRWHRHWAAERAAMRQKHEALADQQRELEKEHESFEHEKAAFDQVRLRLNGELELGRRRLQAEGEQLRQAQQQWQEACTRERAELDERTRVLVEREMALTRAERDLAEETRRGEGTCLGLQREAEGLEVRVSNQRHKLQEQQAEVARLEETLQKLQGCLPATGATVQTETGPADIVFPSSLPLVVEQQREELKLVEQDMQLRMGALEKLSCELADQRLHLIEQCERLAWTEQGWRKEHAVAAAELEAVGLRLQEREQAAAAREQAVLAAEAACAQRHEAAACIHRYLESWRARLTARAVSWEGERNRQLADVRTREQLADRKLKLLTDLGGRWQQRRRQELDRLRVEYGACRKLRREYTAIRDDYVRRAAVVDRARHALAERIETVQRSSRPQPDSAAGADTEAARQLQRFRRRLALISAAAGKFLARERKALKAEAARLEQRHAHVHEYAERVLLLETDLSKRQTTWERERVRADGEQAKLRHEVQRMQAQRGIYENQLAELTDEVERLARVLFDYTDTDNHPAAQAA